MILARELVAGGDWLVTGVGGGCRLVPPYQLLLGRHLTNSRIETQLRYVRGYFVSVIPQIPQSLFHGNTLKLAKLP